jgi:hypothetical protein
MMTRDEFERDLWTVRQSPLMAVDRLDALERLGVATVEGGGGVFPWLTEYKALLRELMVESDEHLRFSAVSDLAMFKDATVQKRLLDGLSGQSAPLVPEAMALQLLAYDTHGEDIIVCRRIAVDRAKENDARIEAIRSLARDTASVERLSSLMMDTTEDSQIRLWGGLSLRALAPSAFAMLASQLLDAAADPSSVPLRNMCTVAFRTSPTLGQ